MQERIRVLVIDDSAIVRKILTDTLSSEPDIEVVGAVPDPIAAREQIRLLRPDVLTLDLEMPRMDGLSFLRELMKENPMPVIVVSSLAQSGCKSAIAAMESGALDVVSKPAGPYSVGNLRALLAPKIRAAAEARLSRGVRRMMGEFPPVAPLSIRSRTGRTASMIAIGASTGGTDAVRRILGQMPANSPAVLIVQHIPAGFSRAFAESLSRVCRMSVKEAEDGDVLRQGLALVAPGDFHLVLKRNGLGWAVAVKSGPQVSFQRPSVNVLFQSIAELAGSTAIGVILTGMGGDGAQGLLRMKERGAVTIGQDEATSVVYGMPREAARIGALDHILPLDDIPRALCALMNPGEP